MPSCYNYNSLTADNVDGSNLFRLSPTIPQDPPLNSKVVALTAPPWKKENNQEEVTLSEKSLDNNTNQEETDLNNKLANNVENQLGDVGGNLLNISANEQSEETSKKSILYKVRKWLANIINPDLPSSG